MKKVKKQSNRIMINTKSGFSYLILALIIFGSIGLEFVWAYCFEPSVFHIPMEEYTAGQKIFHWILTCASWGCMAIVILHIAKKKIGFSLFRTDDISAFQSKIRALCMIGLAGCVIFSLILSYTDWSGSKVLMEFRKLGAIPFIFQYMYYAFETFMFFLIIVFAQKAFEEWFGHANFPYGGIIVALTWGLGHILSKGSVLTGCLTAVGGFVYGIIYLLTNRNVKVSYLLLFICFVL